LADVIRFFKGAKLSIGLIWNELMNVNFPRDVPALSVPVIFFVGRYDYTTPFELVAAYFESLVAPWKKLVWFENSAHMANLEEPDKFQRELIALAQALHLDEASKLHGPAESAARDIAVAAPSLCTQVDTNGVEC
jgi:pimeloyl-ACP methyl ester carboxylesterase